MAEQSTTGADDPKPYWIVVLETTDAGIPRQSPDKPHLKICKCLTEPGIQLRKRFAKKGSCKPGELVAVRDDLMPGPLSPGGLHQPFLLPTDRKEFKAAKEKLLDRLQCQGFTVNQLSAAWSLYVIELDPSEAATKQPDCKGHFYVGQTKKPVAERIEQHRKGKDPDRGDRPAVHSKDANKYFLRPRLDLVPNDFPSRFFCKEHALRAEALLCRRLLALGYEVKGGQERRDLMETMSDNLDAICCEACSTGA